MKIIIVVPEVKYKLIKHLDDIMAIIKEYSQNNEECKITFLLEKAFAKRFNNICVLGDFNNWSLGLNNFTENEDSFSTSIHVLSNNSYHFRYLANGVNWFNESEADDEVDGYYEGSKNSVIIV